MESALENVLDRVEVEMVSKPTQQESWKLPRLFLIDQLRKQRQYRLIRDCVLLFLVCIGAILAFIWLYG